MSLEKDTQETAQKLGDELNAMKYIDYREKLASIDRQLAEHDRTRQEIKLEPWKLALGGFTAGIGLIVLALTMLKLTGVINV